MQLCCWQPASGAGLPSVLSERRACGRGCTAGLPWAAALACPGITPSGITLLSICVAASCGCLGLLTCCDLQQRKVLQLQQAACKQCDACFEPHCSLSERCSAVCDRAGLGKQSWRARHRLSRRRCGSPVRQHVQACHALGYLPAAAQVFTGLGTLDWSGGRLLLLYVHRQCSHKPLAL